MRDPFPCQQFYSLKEVIKSSLQYDICELYKWDECLHIHFYGWGSWGTNGKERTCHAFSQERSPAVLENESSLSVSWSTAQPIRLFLLVEEEPCAAPVLVMHRLYLQICFALFSQHSIFSLISDVSSSAAQPDTFLHEEPCVLPFISCPPVSFMPLIIQTLFWFIKCTASVTEVFWRPCLSRDVPLCKCHTNAELHSSSGNDQIQVISLELLHF